MLAGGNSEAVVPCDILIEDGRIASLGAVGTIPASDATVRDMRGGLVLPAFADIRTHIDKGHIWPRMPNPDGTFPSALDAVGRDRVARWSATDVERRMEFALRCAYAHGTSALRTHIDSLPPQEEISWPVFEAMRDRWKGRIALQGVDETRLFNMTVVKALTLPQQMSRIGALPIMPARFKTVIRI
jgi:cytosine deaminase